MVRIFLSIIAFLFLLPAFVIAQTKPSYYEARVLRVQEQESKQLIKTSSKLVQVEILKGPLKNKKFEIVLDLPAGKVLNFSEKDTILVSYQKDASGNESVFVVDYVRSRELLFLLFVFLAVVFAIGKWKGITSFVGMIISFFIIGGFIIPNIMLGNDPVLISLMGAFFIIPITFYIAHGFTKKTTIAMTSTFFSLVLTGLLAYLFVVLTRLNGSAAEEVTYLQVMDSSINIRSLLLAGIIIGAMGVLDDITISQTSIVEQLTIANPKYSLKELYMRAMEVGRDHIASLVNTLVLVYAGASLPLFLLFFNTKLPYSYVINQEIVTTEIVRTLVSSIGIVAAVPLTTLLAAFYLRRKV